MSLRPYDPNRDRPAAHRIWKEVGWLSRAEDVHLDAFLECGRGMVAEVNGEAECLVFTCPGTMRYLDEELPFACVTGVTTGRVARKQGLAKQVTARVLAADADGGALVAGLGMFEQGYYNQLGFGSGGYEHWVSFDPARLTVTSPFRPPRRLTADDWEAIHAARLARWPGHGRCNLTPAAVTRHELSEEHGFGLGYFDGPNGELTHCLWLSPKANSEIGPYDVHLAVFRTREQFLELMAVLRSLGDQVRLMTIREPQGIQLQDLVERPFQLGRVTEKTRFESGIRAFAYWQMRILDLPACLARTRLPGRDLRLNLSLTDPIDRVLGEAEPWQGVAGGYIVTLGEKSSAVRGTDPSLPTLSASANAFTRLWLGVRPATGLAITDDLSGPPGMLEQLDEVFRLPEPKPDWDF